MKAFTKASSVISLFKQALLGSEQNFTEGSINRAIFLLSVPMILEMSMEALFAVVDVFYVSRLNDNDALAAVTLTESMLTLIYSIAIGLSMGVTALVARRVGEKEIPAASVAAVQSLYIGVGISVVITVGGLLFAEDLLALMGASSSIIQNCSGYTKWMLGGNLTIMLLFLINAIFRGAGDASLALRALVISNGLNIILDPVFIFGFGPVPAFGVEGAAIATNIGRGVGVLYQIYHLWRGKGLIKIHVENFMVQTSVMMNLIRISLGGTLQFLIGSASWIFLVRIMSTFGSEALAGYSIAIRVIIFTILPSWGMANASATLVGQNLGAGQPERAEQSVWKTGFYNMIFLVGVMIIFLLFARPILEFFTSDARVIEFGIECLRVIALGYVFYGYGMVIAQSFNGAGDTRTPTLLNFFGFWCFQIPLAYALAITFNFGPTGVYAAISIAESAIAIAGILIFRQGKWKAVKI
ncbi:MAG: MATE family efflux transporter [Cyclobacteriaceae bacterium]|jgi:putative MATE family efflux protein